MGALLWGDNAVSWPMNFEGHSGDDDVQSSAFVWEAHKDPGKHTQAPVDV